MLDACATRMLGGRRRLVRLLFLGVVLVLFLDLSFRMVNGPKQGVAEAILAAWMGRSAQSHHRGWHETDGDLIDMDTYPSVRNTGRPFLEQGLPGKEDNPTRFARPTKDSTEDADPTSEDALNDELGEFRTTVLEPVIDFGDQDPTPTRAPTVPPAASPTAKPTATPTATPTAKPTATPTAKPTATPTAKPTATPTAKPTAQPTAQPTARVTDLPTAAPTSQVTVPPRTEAPHVHPDDDNDDDDDDDEFDDILPGERNVPALPSKGTIRTLPPVKDRVPYDAIIDSRDPAHVRVGAFPDDPRRYRLCHMENVCINGTHAIFPAHDDAMYSKLKKAIATCDTNQRSQLCYCFTPSTTFVTERVKPDSELLTHVLPGHRWVVDKHVHGSQFGHWTESLVLFHSIYLQWDSYALPDIDGLVMLKSTPPMSDHERFIYERATANIRNHVTETIWEDELHWRTQPYLCFQRLSASSLTALVARRHEDGEPFRDNAFEALGIERQACPPSKTVILLREGARSRSILNLPKVRELMSRLGLLDVHLETITGGNTSAQQTSLFSSTGLLVASHSSQLLNLLFMQSNAAAIEVVPTFFNSDFAQNAHLMNVAYFYALGGRTDDEPVPASSLECDEALRQACPDGESHCLLLAIYRANDGCADTPQYKSAAKALKQSDFECNLDAMERALMGAIDHLNEQCGGHWPGVRAE